MNTKFNKNILWVVGLTLLPTPQPVKAHSYIPETIAAVGTLTTIATVGLLCWRAQSHAYEQATRDQIYAQEQTNNNSINAVININPTRDLFEIVRVFELDQVINTPLGQHLGEYCTQKSVSIDTLCYKLETYTSQAEQAFVQLKTNYEFWHATQAPLAALAHATLNNPRIQHNLITLRNMCQSMQGVKEYVRAYCDYKNIATKSYPYDSNQFPLICVVNDINNDLETLAKASRNLFSFSRSLPVSHELINCCMTLEDCIASTISQLAEQKERIITSAEYQQQKSAKFILQQQQEAQERVYALERQRLAQHKETDQRAYELEEQRVALERRRVENERNALQLKNHDWEELKATIRTLRDEKNELTKALEKLQKKYATLEREAQRAS